MRIVESLRKKDDMEETKRLLVAFKAIVDLAFMFDSRLVLLLSSILREYTDGYRLLFHRNYRRILLVFNAL